MNKTLEALARIVEEVRTTTDRNQRNAGTDYRARIFIDEHGQALVDQIASKAAVPLVVKPLEWERKWFRLTAQTFYGRYSVGKETWTGVGFEMRDPDCGDSDTLATGEYETEQAALDAAQATHEARIRSALTHPAPAVREGWKLVPVEPTESMIEAGHAQIDWCRDDQDTHRPGHLSQKPEGVGTDCGEDIRDARATMLAAAPETK